MIVTIRPSKSNAQKPTKWARVAGSLDITPINQYTVVCHMASNNPQKMYSQMRLGYALSEMSIFTFVFSTVSRV